MTFIFATDVSDNATGARNTIIQPGRYRAEVFFCKEKTSAKGASMLSVGLGLDMGSLPNVKIFDNLVSHSSMLWKIKHFCEAIGCPEAASIGRLDAEDALGKWVEIEVGIEDERDNGKGGKWPKRNVVTNYFTKNPYLGNKDFNKQVDNNDFNAQEAPVDEGAFNNDDIPF